LWNEAVEKGLKHEQVQACFDKLSNWVKQCEQTAPQISDWVKQHEQISPKNIYEEAHAI